MHRKHLRTMPKSNLVDVANCGKCEDLMGWRKHSVALSFTIHKLAQLEHKKRKVKDFSLFVKKSRHQGFLLVGQKQKNC